MVTAGKDKSKTGKIVSVDAQENTVVVEGVNIATKHVKPQGGQPGQIVRVERAISAANVQFLCPDTKKPTRVGFRFEDGKKVRFSKKSGKTI